MMTEVANALGESAGAVYYSGRQLDKVPATLPENPAPSEVVAQHIRDLRMLDSNPRLNLASYVTTWMEEPVQKLIMESLSVNHVDSGIYRSSTDIEERCLSILAHLWNAPNADKPIGCAAVGSTEACLLGGVNLKKRWMQRRKSEGLPIDKPNIIVSYSFQVCWEKLCALWDIEMRPGPLKCGRYVLEPEDVERLADENTIGVAAILGNTYTGDFDDIAAISAVCDKLRQEKGYDLGIHVDGASGAFIAPFLYPDLVWDFRIPNVLSISTSGHKYGLVYPGIGWLVFKSEEDLHKDLVFHLTYLGTQQRNLTLNFSRPASHIVASYYQFLRLGRQGYTMVAHTMQTVAAFLAEGLTQHGAFYVLNDPKQTVPMVTFALRPYASSPDAAATDGETMSGAEGGVPLPKELQGGRIRPYTMFELADKIKERGFSIPAYKMAPNCENITVARCVIREDFSHVMAEKLLEAFAEAIDSLDTQYASISRAQRDEAAERDAARGLRTLRAPSMIKRTVKEHPVC